MKQLLMCLFFLFIGIVSKASSLNSEQEFSIESIETRLAALQIPTDKLEIMPTKELLQSCLAFPFSFDMFAYGGDMEGFEKMAREYNGFQALFVRSDIVPCLLEEYKKLPCQIESTLSKSDLEKGNLSLRTMLLELILIRESTIDLMSEKQIVECSDILEKNNEIMARHSDIFSGIHSLPLQYFSTRKKVANANINCPRGTSALNYNTVIYTPNGTQIPVEAVYDELNSQEILSMYNYVVTNYPSAQIVENASKKYNCHAYAWHLSQGETNKVWLKSTDSEEQNELLKSYWEDGSFCSSSALHATQILYAGDHSALRYDDTHYISKWGLLPLVIHAPNYVPYGYLPSSSKSYYRRNFTVSGPSYITGSAVYCISGLTSGCNVSWSVSNSYYNSYLLQGDAPNTNECTITQHPTIRLTNDTLNAIVTRNGKTIAKLGKIVSTRSAFTGTYYNGQSTLLINYPDPLYVLPGTYVHIWSPNLYGASVSYTGNTTPTTWLFDSVGGTLDVGMPTNNNATLVVNVVGEGADNYNLPIIVTPNLNQLSVSVSDGLMEVSVVSYISDELLQSCGMKSSNKTTKSKEWTLEVYNVMTGEKRLGKRVTDSSCFIDVSGWRKGIYSVCAVTDKGVLKEKVVIK